MKKSDREDLIFRYFENDTTPEEELELHNWIHADPANQKLFDEYDFTYTAMLMHGPDVHIPVTPKPRFGVRFWRRLAVQAAAVVVLAAGINYLFFRPTLPDKTYTIEVPSGERIKFTLEDSTVVWLNGGTLLEYPALFGERSRRVRVDGEAYFDVAPEAGRPFVVQTFACDLQVLGTRFNVEAREENHTFSAALLSGSLLAFDFRDGDREQIILRPNDLLVYSNGGFSVGPMGNPGVYSWQDDLIRIDGLRFDEMMRLFEKVFGVRIVLDRATLPELTIECGKFRKSYGIENILCALARGSEFTFDFDRENNVITIR